MTTPSFSVTLPCILNYMAKPKLSPLKQSPRVVGSGSLSRPSRPGRTAFQGPVLATPAVVPVPGKVADYRKGKNPNTGK